MKVKFLVDECTGKRLSNLLNAAGYDAIFVGDGNHLHLMKKFWTKQTKKEES